MILGRIKMKLFKEHAMSLGVSPSFLLYKHPSDCLQVDEMIISSKSKEEFESQVNDALIHHEIGDFYDFSLIMGMITGVYNIYPYEFFTEKIKQRLVESSIPNHDLFRDFINQYFESISNYFFDFYHINRQEVQDDINQMFLVVSDDSIYKSRVCSDVGKMLVVYSLDGYQKEAVSESIASGQFLSIFDELCHYQKKIQVFRK